MNTFGLGIFYKQPKRSAQKKKKKKTQVRLARSVSYMVGGEAGQGVSYMVAGLC